MSSMSADGTDAHNFSVKGIPASGVLTGQNCYKTQDEVNLFGGSTGNFEGNLGTFDGGCVDTLFRWCDNVSNNDPTVLTFMSRTFANMVVTMAFQSNDIAGQQRPKVTPDWAACRAAERIVAVVPIAVPGMSVQARHNRRHPCPPSRTWLKSSWSSKIWNAPCASTAIRWAWR